MTPIATKLPSTSNDTPFSDPELYRSLVGSLQYLTITRPDLSYAVNRACQHMHAPMNSHFQALKRLLRFVKGSLHHGLLFQHGPLQLTAYSDSDWAGDTIDRKSTTGNCLYLGSNLISWSSKKQPTVAKSSIEAEYKALSVTAAEVVWIQQILSDLHISLSHTPLLWCDNISSLSLATNPVFHARTKHVEVDYHFIREKIGHKQLQIAHISSIDQLADLFTKPLSTARFQ